VSLREGMCLRLTYLRTRCSLFSCIVCCVRISLECHCRRMRTSACAERTALFNYDVESPTREIPTHPYSLRRRAQSKNSSSLSSHACICTYLCNCLVVFLFHLKEQKKFCLSTFKLKTRSLSHVQDPRHLEARCA